MKQLLVVLALFLGTAICRANKPKTNYRGTFQINTLTSHSLSMTIRGQAANHLFDELTSQPNSQFHVDHSHRNWNYKVIENSFIYCRKRLAKNMSARINEWTSLNDNTICQISAGQ